MPCCGMYSKYVPVYLINRGNERNLVIMKKCEVLGYLFDYTLTTHFEENKTRFAKGLSLPTSEIYRMQKHLAGGGTSGITAERLLALFWRKGLSLDEALRQYEPSITASPRISDHESIAFMNVGTQRDIIECRKYKREISQEIETEHRISTLVYSLMIMIERHFCRGSICKAASCDYCIIISEQEICPFSLLTQFINQLRQYYFYSEESV